MHLDQYRKGAIDGDDLAQAIEEIVFGEIKAPGQEGFTEFGVKPPEDVLPN